MRRLGPVVLLATVALVAAYLIWPVPTDDGEEGFSLQNLLGGSPSGYAQADVVRQFDFPADHGPHPDFRSEWWYVTGNLRSRDGRRFGFQFTLFRFALAPHAVARRSDWGTRQAYMAHFAVTDAASGRIHAFERFSRGALGLAGAELDPVRVWLDDWQLGGNGDAFPAMLTAAEDDVALRLSLAPRKPLVLQGEDGLSRKGPEPGNASYYYAYTRLGARGELRLGGQEFAVEGTAWLDREWSTSALSPGVEGWDWFALQLDDGSDLMVYRLRTGQGGASPFSAATYVSPDGTVRRLAADEFELTPVGHWLSPATGVRYPVRWRLRIPKLTTDLGVAAVFDDQELDLSVRYWEGAVDVDGSVNGRQVDGVGYMELTGYGAGGARAVSPR